MTGRDDQARRAREDAEWRSIVENFGDRADLPEPEPRSDPEPEPAPDLGPATHEPAFAAPDPGPAADVPAELASSGWDDEGHYVPPEPPPLPRPTGVRLAAWFGLFGVPTLALLSVILGVSLPSVVVLLFIAGFVGGFGYLVATMSGRDPDSGWDDGAVL